jgi:hypothetical protein
LLSALLVAAVAVLALSGCQIPFQSQVTVSGKVYGEQIAAREAGNSMPVPLRATITCNGASGSSGSDGAFSFSVSQASTYTCAATAKNYSSVTAHVSAKGRTLAVNFGPKPASGCTSDASKDAFICGVLPPAKATLRGTVINAATDQALPNALVKCWNTSLDEDSSATSSRVTATTDVRGNYIMRNLPVGPYGCVAEQDQTLQRTTLAPGQTTTLELPVCSSICSPFRYRLGTVVHRLTAYLIYWLPSGYVFEPHGSDSRFERLTEQYMRDVGGTPFYNILSQYYDDVGGPVRNVVTLGGTYVDTARYPTAGTVGDPLLDSDISNEIERVVSLKQGAWTSDPDHIYFLFTGYNVQECSGTTASDGCTFNHNREADFCAYHSYSVYSITYAYIPVIDSCQYLPTTTSPNHDRIADATISIVSHEQFEAVSDPSLQGWYDNTTYEGEMADKCVDSYGPLGSDGGNVTLANGHRYILQEEWSLRDRACVLSLS